MKYILTVALVQAGSFLKKKVFLKLTIFFVVGYKHNLAKVITFSESTSKIKVKSSWALFFILLTSAVINIQTFCMEKRLNNIF